MESQKWLLKLGHIPLDYIHNLKMVLMLEDLLQAVEFQISLFMEGLHIKLQ